MYIKILQLSQNNEVFDDAAKLFIKKYKTEKDFIAYFKKEWLDTHEGWYEGYAKNTPSTNNALESSNRYVKDNGTLRARLDLSMFLSVAKQIIRNFSFERNPHNINFVQFKANKSDLTIKEWTNGFLWAKAKKEIRSNENVHYVPCHLDTKINLIELS